MAGDKAFDTADFVEDCRDLGYTPHVTQNINKYRGSNIDDRTVSRPGYGVSQRLRKRVEEIFGWWKTIGGGRKPRYIGLRRNRFWAEMASSGYDLVRMTNLAVAAARQAPSGRNLRPEAGQRTLLRRPPKGLLRLAAPRAGHCIPSRRNYPSHEPAGRFFISLLTPAAQG